MQRIVDGRLYWYALSFHTRSIGFLDLSQTENLHLFVLLQVYNNINILSLT